MSVQDLDRALVQWQHTVERVGANLVALERDQHCQTLAAATLEGATAARWNDAQRALAGVFDGYASLASVVDRAAQARGASRSVAPATTAELNHLLFGASVERSHGHLDPADRGLLDASVKVATTTPTDLLAEMTTQFEAVRTTINEVGAVWDVLVPRVATVREELEHAARQAQPLGDDWNAEIEAARRRAGELGDRLLSDPLTLDSRELDALAALVAALVDDIENARRLQRDTSARLGAAQRLLEELETAERAGRELYDEVVAKIIVPALPEIPVQSARFSSELNGLSTRLQNGEWRTAARVFDAWSRTAEGALCAVHEATAAAELALRRRAELRGRLDAYNAKAGSLGMGEDAELARMYEATQNALYDAPIDLERAGALMHRYQNAIAMGRDERKGRR